MNGPPPAGGSAPEPAYARFLPRLRALFIDVIIIMAAIFTAVFIAVVVRSDDLARPLGVLVAALWLLYEPLLVSLAGGTVGHRLCNLRVVDDRTDGNVSFLKAAARTVIKALLGWVSFVSMLTTRRSQAIHDLLTRSTVQMRDRARADPSQYIHERREFASQALPSRTRRALVIGAYLLLVMAAYMLVLVGLILLGVVSTGCALSNRCSQWDNLVVLVGNVAWLGLCVICVGLGWRGRLYGARAD
jgi:uncharacterized RDD family membrane protein YckC